MFDGAAAALCEKVGAITYCLFKRLVWHQGIDQLAIESFGNASEGGDLDSAFGFRLFERDDRRLSDLRTFAQLLGRHAEGFPDCLHPAADRRRKGCGRRK